MYSSPANSAASPRRLALALALAMASGASSRAQDSPATPPPVEKGDGGETAADLRALIAALGSPRPAERERAAEALFARGEAALPALEAAAGDASNPEIAPAARWLAFRVRWGVSRALAAAAGPLLDGFDARPPAERTRAVVEIAAAGGDAALDLLLRVALRDADERVKRQALRSFTLLGGWSKRQDALLTMPASQGLALAQVGILLGGGPDLFLVAARILAREGKHEQAVSALAQAVWNGVSPDTDLLASPELAALRDDRRVISQVYSKRGLDELTKAQQSVVTGERPGVFAPVPSDPEADALRAAAAREARGTPKNPPGIDPGAEARDAWWRAAERTLRRAVALDDANRVAWYNLACALSLQGKAAAALAALQRAADEGFEDYRHMEEDPDLAPLRDHPLFRRLIDDLRLARSKKAG